MPENLSNEAPARRLTSIVSAILIAAVILATTSSAAPPAGQASIVPANAVVEELWNDGEFTEGVAVAPDGTIYFSDIPSSETAGRVLKFDPATGKTSVHCADSRKSNGLMFDRTGRLIAACGANVGQRALCEITPAGEVRILVDKYQGKAFNSPNDLVIHPDGSVYFTDPRYVGDEPLELNHMSVYCFVPSTGQLTRVTTDNTKPNGIVCAPDGRTLYIAQTDNGKEKLDDDSPAVRPSQMKLAAYPRNPDRSLGKRRVLVDLGEKAGIDGMTVDQQGHIYAALRDPKHAGIAVYTPQGEKIAHIATRVLPSNCCFGRGKEASTLYITAGGGLFRILLKIPGYHPATASVR